MAYLPPQKQKGMAGYLQAPASPLTQSAGAPAASGAAPMPGAAPQQAGTGFVNLGSYLSANQGAGADLAAKTAHDAAQQTTDRIEQGNGGLPGNGMQGYAQQERDAATNFPQNTQESRQAALQATAGKQGGYSHGMGGLDAYLMGAGGGSDWAKQAQQQIAQRGDYWQQQVDALKPPPQTPIDHGTSTVGVPAPTTPTAPRPGPTWDGGNAGGGTGWDAGGGGDSIWDPVTKTWKPRAGAAGH